MNAISIRIFLIALMALTATSAITGRVNAESGDTYTDLHDFGGTILDASNVTGQDGSSIYGGVTLDGSGNLYGIATNAGPNNGGLVWEMTQAGEYKDLFDFNSTENDAFCPQGGITFDANGNMYGMTSEGGANAPGDFGGNIWEITTLGSYLDLHDFAGTVTNADGTTGPDGASPDGKIAISADGNLYGTTNSGGPYVEFSVPEGEFDNGGNVWEINATGAYVDLHDFGGTITNADGLPGPDGYSPTSGVTFDGNGNMYGTTPFGGPNPCPSDTFSYVQGAGMVWEITATGQYKDLHDFGGTVLVNGKSVPDASCPFGGVTFDGSGNMYGTAACGGAYAADPGAGGVVWEITASGQYLIVHSFGNPSKVTEADGTLGSDGINPGGPITFDSAGNMYGIANDSGNFSNSGVAWEISNNGVYVILHNFGGTVTNADETSGTDGDYTNHLAPGMSGGLTLDNAGDLYGAATYGGPHASGDTMGGVIWKISNIPSIPPSVPGAPYPLTATAGVQSVTLSWTTSPWATSYTVYDSTVAGQESTHAIARGVTDTSYTATGLTPGTTYYFIVRGNNNKGESVASNQASTAPSAPPLPSAPYPLTARSGFQSVSLSWAASTWATSYTVYDSTVAGQESTHAIARGVAGTSYTVTGLTPGTTYYFIVRGIDSTGESAASNQASAAASATPLPTAPYPLTATGGAQSVSLRWASSTWATSYTVYDSTVAGQESTHAVARGVAGTSYTVTGLTPGTTYYFIVRGINDTGESVASNQASAEPLPTAPYPLTATGGVQSVSLTWSPSAGATSYTVYDSTVAGQESTHAIARGVAGTSYIVSGLTPGTTYYFIVRGINTAGESVASNQASAVPVNAAD